MLASCVQYNSQHKMQRKQPSEWQGHAFAFCVTQKSKRVDKQECMRSSSATKVAMSTEPGTVCCYQVWKTHAPAKKLSLIIFNRAGNVATSRATMRGTTNQFAFRATHFWLRHFHTKVIRSCQPLSVVSLVAGVTRVCVVWIARSSI